MKKWVVWIAFLLALFCIITLVDESMRRQHENIPRTSWGVGENVPTANPAIKDGQWDVTQLIEVKEGRFPEAPAGVYMTLKAIEDNRLLAELHNDTAERWEYGEDGVSWLVKLDGKWYQCPALPRSSVAIAHPLEPGAVVEESFSLSGNSPAGTYCVVKKIQQGSIPENNFIQCYLTLEFDIP